MSLPGRGVGREAVGRKAAGCGVVGRSALLALAMLAGCAAPGLRQPGAGSGGSEEATLPPLAGSVDRRFLYRIQATIKEDVAPAASVSFIEPGTLPRTVATTVTTDDGRFVLDLGGRFSPRDGAVYYLEAFKGLGSNQAGFNAGGCAPWSGGRTDGRA